MDEHFETKYADLDNLSTQALKEIIRADFTSDGLDGDYIMRALEVIEQRELSDGTAKPIDVDAAWKDFRQTYCTEEGRGQSLYDGREPQDTLLESQEVKKNRKNHKVFRFAVKRIGLVAALLALLLSGMIVVQAAGVDIFGAIARWTDEVFHFGDSAVAASTDWRDELVSLGVDRKHIPNWIPEGFEAGEVVVDELPSWREILLPFHSNDSYQFHIKILTYYNITSVNWHALEKDGNNVEQYIHNNQTYYIFSNLDGMTGICLDGLVEISVGGNLTAPELKQIIDSIGGT